MQIEEFKTNFATFKIWEENGKIMESHCGFSIGCFYTKPECIGFVEDSQSLKEIKNQYIEFYGRYID